MRRPLLLFATLLISTVWAELPPRPELNPKASPVTRKLAQEEVVGRILLKSGSVEVWTADQAPLALSVPLPLAQGDLLHVLPEGRLYLELPYGDILELAGEAWVQIKVTDRGVELFWWQGKGLLQVMPTLTGRRHPLIVHLSHGEARLLTGQVGIASGDGREKLAVFDNALLWQEGNRRRPLVSGTLLKWSKVDSVSLASLDPKEAVLEWRSVVSLLPTLLREALNLFKEGQLDAAQAKFAMVQHAFPENPIAAYYLGQIALEQRHLSEVVRQWRHYSRLDPEGARTTGVEQFLTALITEVIGEEIETLLKQEKRLAALEPEPNTVAVAPLVLRDPPKDPKLKARYRRLAKALVGLIVADLAKIPGLKVLERAKVEKLMQELKLAESGLLDPKQSVRLGRLLRAEKVLVGGYQIKGGDEP